MRFLPYVPGFLIGVVLFFVLDVELFSWRGAIAFVLLTAAVCIGAVIGVEREWARQQGHRR